MSEYDTLGRLIGLPARDYFGRDVGKVICCSHDGAGEINKVVISGSDGGIEEYDRADVEISSSAVTIKDKLIFAARTLRKEIEINARRTQALEELRKNSKMHQRVYMELKMEFDTELTALNEKKRNLTDMADLRRNEVAKKLMALEKIRATVEVQAMSGEIDENVYRSALSEIKSAIDRSTKELDDLERELSFLDVEFVPKKEAELYLEPTSYKPIQEETSVPSGESSGAIPGFSSEAPMGMADGMSGPLHVRRV